MKRSCQVSAASALAALAFVLGTAAGIAQTAELPTPPSAAGNAPAGTQAEPRPSAGDSVQGGDPIAKALEAAQSRLDALEHATDPALAAPPDTPVNEIADRLTLARQLVGIYQQQRDSIERTETARKRRIETEQAAQRWQGFATPPPYSVLTVDALRDSAEAAQTRITSAQTRRALFERFADEIGARTKASQAAARLAAEAADRARGTPAAARLEWLRGLAALRAAVDEATEQLLQLGIRSAREDIAASEAARDFARRQLDAAGHEIVFRPEDLARVNAALDARRHAIESALQKATGAAAAAQAARMAAENDLAQARSAPAAAAEDAAARAAREETLARDADQAREQAITATLRVDLLKGYLTALGGERTAWDVRAAALQTRDPLRARAAYEQLTTTLATIRAWREYLNQQIVAARDLVAEQETKLRTASAAEAVSAQLLIETYRQRESDLRQAQDRTQPLERLLSNFRADFEGRREVSIAERARDTAAAALLWARRVWNYEILTVEDSLQTAEGRTITVERSVTIGKSAGAVLIVVLGYWLCSALARLVERMVVKRRRVAPQAAALLRSWILFVLAAILVIFALVSASIPLTVFAFLGGALAIAAGFGLQAVLKNFVAGIMLLFERPMRLGDLVEVDGFRGRVTAIGIRASTILSADGIETLIPNSAFIENKLTNWTYSTPQARHTIKIGVAYGTPLRNAADVLQDVLARHGLVMKDPAPQVYLEEYADSAIGFALTYWTMMTPESDTRRVKSDLLHMIDRAFADAGIGMPFP